MKSVHEIRRQLCFQKRCRIWAHHAAMTQAATGHIADQITGWTSQLGNNIETMRRLKPKEDLVRLAVTHGAGADF